VGVILFSFLLPTRRHPLKSRPETAQTFSTSSPALPLGRSNLNDQLSSGIGAARWPKGGRSKSLK